MKEMARMQVGSIYEYFNKNAIFGLVQPGNPAYAPILGFFAITGLPLSGDEEHCSIHQACCVPVC